MAFVLLVLVFVLWHLPGAVAQTGEAMLNEQQVLVELDENRLGSYIRIRWSKHGAVSAEVKNAAGAAVSWTGDLPEERIMALEKILSRVRPFSNGTEFHLKIDRPGKGITLTAWDVETEPPSLRELRHDLELMAHVPYLVAKSALIQGNDERATMAFAAAALSYRHGIEELANLYSSSYLLDDTGVSLALARLSDEKGDVKTASAVYGRVLESRIHAYEEKHHF